MQKRSPVTGNQQKDMERGPEEKLDRIRHVPSAIYLPVRFNYMPMAWLAMAFEDFSFRKGILGSDWVGFANFARLFSLDQFWLAFRNTVCMALINLVFGFFFPLVLALLLSEVRVKWFRRGVQTISFLPYFISTVVVCMMFKLFLDKDGIITELLVSIFHITPQNLLTNGDIPVFWLINAFIEVWQKTGYSSIMFVAVLSNIDNSIMEAAAIDGANRWDRLVKIKLPAIMPLRADHAYPERRTDFHAGL